MDSFTAWPTVRALAKRTFLSSLHFAFVTVNADGTPHLTPIGSLMLAADRPEGVFFEVFSTQMVRNLEERPRVCVLAVNSSAAVWLLALLRGRFTTPPAARLLGTVGPRREATPAELARWRRRTQGLWRLKGGQRLWGQIRYARTIHFDAVEPVHLGKMTRGIWPMERIVR
jgi:flavin reductase (DIM6/NTAB) family NADH-FMN oxidoreductase RutF